MLAARLPLLVKVPEPLKIQVAPLTTSLTAYAVLPESVGGVALVERKITVSLAELVLAGVQDKLMFEELVAVAVCAVGLGTAATVIVKLETGVPYAFSHALVLRLYHAKVVGVVLYCNRIPQYHVPALVNRPEVLDLASPPVNEVAAPAVPL